MNFNRFSHHMTNILPIEGTCNSIYHYNFALTRDFLFAMLDRKSLTPNLNEPNSDASYYRKIQGSESTDWDPWEEKRRKRLSGELKKY